MTDETPFVQRIAVVEADVVTLDLEGLEASAKALRDAGVPGIAEIELDPRRFPPKLIARYYYDSDDNSAAEPVPADPAEAHR
jgi:hypothetical protein